MGDMAYKQQHRERGLCINCSQPHALGDYFCLKCRWLYRDAMRKYYHLHKEQRDKDRDERRQRYKEERRCIDCGIYLIEDESVSCVNCREHRNLTTMCNRGVISK